MKKIIIGIHGLGNKPHADILKSWWRTSMEEGLKLKGFPVCEFDFELVYWADLLYEKALDTTVHDKNNPFYIEDPYTPAPEGTNHAKHSSIRQKIVDLIGDQLENLFLNPDLSINFSSVNDFVIRHFFRDLAVYYNTSQDQHATTNGQKKQAIRAALADILARHRKKQIMLIAHSMGAIIAYDVLMQQTDARVDTFVTIGCPLGLPIIRSKIAAEHSKVDDPRSTLRTPENVTNHWYNIADLRDKIALYYKLADDFRPNSRGIKVQDRIVINDFTYHNEKNPHKSYGYLRTGEVTDSIQAFLAASSPGLLTRLTAPIIRLFSR